MLYRPEAFEPLTDEAWDEERVRRAIREIVADADAAFDPGGLWPADEWDAWRSPVPLTNLYGGAAGVVWALGVLRGRGVAETRLDLAAAALRTLETWRETPGFQAGPVATAERESGLLAGETGVVAVAWCQAPDRSLDDELLALVRRSVGGDANELMWGTPGTLLAAQAMLSWTGEERWRDAWLEVADALWRARDPDGLWPQTLYGETSRGLGPPHGAVGNALALLGGSELLAPGRRYELETSMGAALARTAVIEDGLANWPMAEGEELVADDGQIRLQWDYGAPGVVASAASYLDEELLLAGAELVWRAGAHGAEKGAGICHGTAGNGYALLSVFGRTRDEHWLARARRFAVHALAQAERARADRGRGRYSLWTGDVGVALFAADCLDAVSAYPILETWGPPPIGAR